MNKNEVLKELSEKFNDSDVILVDNNAIEKETLSLTYDAYALPVGLIDDCGMVNQYPFTNAVKTGDSSYKIIVDGSYSFDLVLLKTQQF